jgi:hypothetical protein
MNNGQYRCLPNFAGITPFLFADAACTELAAFWLLTRPDG